MGQFADRAATGQVASIMANGPKSSCMQAAQAAINGETVIGNLTHFKRAGSTGDRFDWRAGTCN